MDIPQTNKASYSLEKAYEIVLSYIVLGLGSSGGINPYQAKQIFLLALKDYFEDKIHLYDLGNIAEEIVYVINNPSLGSGDNELDRILFALSDIDIYYEENDPRFKETLKMIQKYWDDHKTELKTQGKHRF